MQQRVCRPVVVTKRAETYHTKDCSHVYNSRPDTLTEYATAKDAAAHRARPCNLFHSSVDKALKYAAEHGTAPR